jgi:hypothetical protein
LLDTALRRRWFAATFASLAILFLAVGALGVFVFLEAGSLYPVDGALPVGAVTIIGGIAVALAAWRDARAAAVACTLGTLIAVNWVLAVRVLPGFEAYKPVAPLSAAISRQLRTDDVVAHFDVAMPSMTFYLRRHVQVTYDKEGFLQVLRSGRRVFAVMPASRFAELRSEFGADACVIARRRSADVRLRNVLAGEAPREVVVAVSPCPSS